MRLLLPNKVIVQSTVKENNKVNQFYKIPQNVIIIYCIFLLIKHVQILDFFKKS